MVRFRVAQSCCRSCVSGVLKEAVVTKGGPYRRSADRRFQRRARPHSRVTFVYCLTPAELGGDGAEYTLLLGSVDGRAVRKRDSRQDAFELLREIVPDQLLRDCGLNGAIEFQDETPCGHVAAVTASNSVAFHVLEQVLHAAGHTSIRFRRKDDLLISNIRTMRQRS